MAEADLDVVIRQLAKQQHKGLMVAAKRRRDRFAGLAAKAKDSHARGCFRQLAKDTMEQAGFAAKRLQMSADNAADSYARSMRNAAADHAAKQAVETKAEKAVRKTVKKAAKKAVKKAVRKTKS